MKFSIFGGKEEEKVSEEDLNEFAQQISDGIEAESGSTSGEMEGHYDEIREKLEDLESRLEQVDASSTALRSELGQFEDRFNSIENNVREMLSLYEMVTKNQNPFFQPDGSNDDRGATNVIKTGEPSFDEEIVPSKPSDQINNQPMEEKEIQKEGASGGLSLPEPNFPDFGEISAENPGNVLDSDDLDNSPESNMLLLRWIEFIMQKVGYTGLSSTLEYYVQIGWISQDAARKIMAFSTGIDPNGTDVKTPKRSTLTVREHLVSLYFVTKLKKEEVFDNVYVSVKDEVEKLGLSLSSESL